jgi:hypothetical protein
MMTPLMQIHYHHQERFSLPQHHHQTPQRCFVEVIPHHRAHYQQQVVDHRRLEVPYVKFIEQVGIEGLYHQQRKQIIQIVH